MKVRHVAGVRVVAVDRGLLERLRGCGRLVDQFKAIAVFRVACEARGWVRGRRHGIKEGKRGKGRRRKAGT